MATGHDADIVILRYAEVRRKGFIISFIDGICLGEQSRIGKFRPVIDDDAGKADTGQDRDQGLRHVAAAKDEDPSRISQGFAVPAPLAIRSKAGYILTAPSRIDGLQSRHLAAALHLAFPDQGHAPMGFIADIQGQPRRRLLAQGLDDSGQYIQQARQGRVEVLAEDGQFPATGSVDIFFVIGVEDEPAKSRLAALQALPAGLDGQIFLITATDSTGRRPIGKDGLMAADAAGRRALAGDDGQEDSRLAGLQSFI